MFPRLDRLRELRVLCLVQCLLHNRVVEARDIDGAQTFLSDFASVLIRKVNDVSLVASGVCDRKAAADM